MASLFKIVLKGLNGALQSLEFDVRREVGYRVRARVESRAEIRVNQHHCISPGAGGQLCGLWRCLRRRDLDFFDRVRAELLAHHE